MIYGNIFGKTGKEDATEEMVNESFHAKLLSNTSDSGFKCEMHVYLYQVKWQVKN